MQPNQTPSGAPTPEQGGLLPEQQRAVPPEAAPVAPQGPTQPAPMPQLPPDPSAQVAQPAHDPNAQPLQPAVPAVASPAVAADVDNIEKEWVDQANKIIDQTKGDPYVEEEAVESLQQDYLKKRYGHDVKKPQQ